MTQQKIADELLSAAGTAALECALAALGAARNQRLGLAAPMDADEAETLWRASTGLLRDLGVWPFPYGSGGRRQSRQRIGTA